MAAPADPIPPVHATVASRPVLDGERERYRGHKSAFSLKNKRKYNDSAPQPTQDQVTLAVAAQARFAADLAQDTQDDHLDSSEEHTDLQEYTDSQPDAYGQQARADVERKTEPTEGVSASATLADQSAVKSEVPDARPHVDDYA